MTKPQGQRITYENPPLGEVSFGLVFEPLVGFRAAHYGAFWSVLGRDFTETVDKPPLLAAADARLGRVTSEWLPLPRVWYVHRNQEHLLQLQPDRFHFNWRRGAAEYPRFENLEPMFREYVGKLGAFVAEHGLGRVNVRGFELTYFNYILRGDGWDGIEDIGQVFPDISWRSRPRPAMRQPSELAWSVTFKGESSQLNATVTHGVQTTPPNREVFVFELKNLTLSQERGFAIEGMHDWFVTANEMIVTAFEDLTSDRMRTEVWKRGRG